MTCLLLLRHAQSVWNAAGLWQGWADPPLSAAGQLQAAEAGPRLAPFGFRAVVSSDLQRARGTAALVTPALDLHGPASVEPGLREYDVGEWSGLTRDEIDRRWPGGVDDWRHGRLTATPGGEDRRAFLARVVASVARIGAAHLDGAVLVITHGGVINALASSLGADRTASVHLAGRWFGAEGDGLRLGPAASFLGP